MSERTFHFQLSEAHLESFSSALVLGTLEAIRAGSWPLDAGIWSLGRPAFRVPLENAGVHEDLASLLREADELPALAALVGREAANERLDAMIASVRARLADADVQPWQAGLHQP